MLDFLSDYIVPITVMAVTVTAVTMAYYLLRHLGRNSPLAKDLVRRAYRPSQVVAVLLSLWVTLWQTADGPWLDTTLHALLLGVIAGGAWLITVLLNVVTTEALRQVSTEVTDGLEARRIRTRVRVAHRVIGAVVSVMAIGVMLITFPEVRTVGASLLASAGLVGIVAALAAQSMLSNMLAGLQLAFGDALRLDDIVVVEGKYGTIEEITLRHVVLRIWDGRRLILPTGYFTNTPFENWTKSDNKLYGVIDLDLDWSVPLDDMRAELTQVLEGSKNWDGRLNLLEVIDATGSLIRVRATISAPDALAQWRLRCEVREALVTWLQETHPTALPRVRTEFGGGGEAQPRWVQPGQALNSSMAPAARSGGGGF